VGIRVGGQHLERKVVKLSNDGEGHIELSGVVVLTVTPPVEVQTRLHPDVGGGTDPHGKKDCRKNRNKNEFSHGIQTSEIFINMIFSKH
jgi:hypothetical protein